MVCVIYLNIFLFLSKCDVCGHCAADSSNPNYNLLTTPAPANVTTESNVGRGKRHTTLSLIDNMKCIRFKVRLAIQTICIL